MFRVDPWCRRSNPSRLPLYLFNTDIMEAWSSETKACCQSRDKTCSTCSVMFDHFMALRRMKSGCLIVNTRNTCRNQNKRAITSRVSKKHRVLQIQQWCSAARPVPETGTRYPHPKPKLFWGLPCPTRFVRKALLQTHCIWRHLRG